MQQANGGATTIQLHVQIINPHIQLLIITCDKGFFVTPRLYTMESDLYIINIVLLINSIDSKTKKNMYSTVSYLLSFE
jgi:hypothetical protein